MRPFVSRLQLPPHTRRSRGPRPEIAPGAPLPASTEAYWDARLQPGEQGVRNGEVMTELTESSQALNLYPWSLTGAGSQEPVFSQHGLNGAAGIELRGKTFSHHGYHPYHALHASREAHLFYVFQTANQEPTSIWLGMWEGAAQAGYRTWPDPRSTRNDLGHIYLRLDTEGRFGVWRDIQDYQHSYFRCDIRGTTNVRDGKPHLLHLHATPDGLWQIHLDGQLERARLTTPLAVDSYPSQIYLAPSAPRSGDYYVRYHGVSLAEPFVFGMAMFVDGAASEAEIAALYDYAWKSWHIEGIEGESTALVSAPDKGPSVQLDALPRPAATTFALDSRAWSLQGNLELGPDRIYGVGGTPLNVNKQTYDSGIAYHREGINYAETVSSRGTGWRIIDGGGTGYRLWANDTDCSLWMLLRTAYAGSSDFDPRLLRFQSNTDSYRIDFQLRADGRVYVERQYLDTYTGAGTSGARNEFMRSTRGINDGELHMLRLRVTAGGTWQIWIDGELDTEYDDVAHIVDGTGLEDSAFLNVTLEGGSVHVVPEEERLEMGFFLTTAGAVTDSEIAALHDYAQAAFAWSQ